ncbi:DUF6326 family protein [Flagellimonas sp. DF-77]|uniref:DUF6326 family protein n=1 Tax=Flagellimonas algarum TaxID=3230298 RepID=UPI00339687BE
MHTRNTTPQGLLSTLWTFVLFNMIFRDLHEFLNDGFLESLKTLHIAEPTMLLYGVILELPILMVILPKLLGDTANRWVNVVVAFIMLLGILSSLFNADLDDLFFGMMGSIALVGIMVIAWKLPTNSNKAAATDA